MGALVSITAVWIGIIILYKLYKKPINSFFKNLTFVIDKIAASIITILFSLFLVVIVLVIIIYIGGGILGILHFGWKQL
jgi:hypothetical protein